MAKKNRWMTWVLEEAETLDIDMPWSRRARTGRWKTRTSVINLQRFLKRA